MVTSLGVLGEQKPEEVALRLLSLVWIETGNGRAMVQHNWGNLAGEYRGSYWRPPWYKLTSSSSARMKALHQRMLAGKAPSKFKAYPDRGTGLDDFLALIYRPQFRPMLEAARAGNTRAFADAVHSTGYCPDDACRGERTIARYEDLRRTFGPALGLGSGSPLMASGGGWIVLALLWALSKGKL